MSNEMLSFNGIDAATGEYLLELSHDDLVKVAVGEELDARTLAELRFRQSNAEANHYGVKEGVDVCKLEETGWAVIFPNTSPGSPEATRQAAIREALQPLLDLRRAQATAVSETRYKEYAGPLGYRAGETKPDFLKRHAVGPGPADPEVMPYYLLLVGDPNEIPYRVQSQLGVQRAVGRIHFDSLDEYASYARSVVASETQGLRLPRRAGFFGVANPNDAATQASAKHLVEPLAALFERQGWSVDRRVREQATRGALLDMLRDAPSVVFTASHGMGFPKDDPRQLAHQGALLCQDWPGPLQWQKKPIPEEFYLAGEHLDPGLNLLGSIFFLFACYGGGTPEHDEFSKKAFKSRAAIAPHAFVAGLPKALLGRPNGGALAAIAHVERAWGYSFMWAGPKRNFIAQTEVFESTLRALMGGMPVGAAMEYFDERYAELASDLSVALEELDAGVAVNEYDLAEMWTANNDARGYAILGDPAVRLRVGDDGEGRGRAAVGVGTVSGPAPAEANPPEEAVAEAGANPSEEAVADAGAPTIEDSPEDYGLLDQLQGDTSSGAAADPLGLQPLIRRVAARLGKTLDAATTIEVRTYVSPTLGAGVVQGEERAGAQLRALTRMKLDGDTVVCLPQRDGKVDTEVWEIHLQMVREAREARAELLKTLVDAAASLARLRP